MAKKDFVRFLRTTVTVLWFTMVFVGLFFVMAYLLYYGRAEAFDDLKNLIVTYPKHTMWVFLGLFIVRGFVFIPVSLFYVLSAFLFPLWQAIILSFVGMLLSGSLIYITAQFVGKNFIEHQHATWLRKINDTLGERGFFAALILIILPISSLDIVAAIGGLSRMTFTDFFLAMIVSAPASLLPYVIGAEAFQDPRLWAVAVVAFALVISITIWAYRHPHFEQIFRFGRKKKRKKWWF